jgi:hypothetical protein
MRPEREDLGVQFSVLLQQMHHTANTGWMGDLPVPFKSLKQFEPRRKQLCEEKIVERQGVCYCVAVNQYLDFCSCRGESTEGEVLDGLQSLRKARQGRVWCAGHNLAAMLPPGWLGRQNRVGHLWLGCTRIRTITLQSMHAQHGWLQYFFSGMVYANDPRPYTLSQATPPPLLQFPLSLSRPNESGSTCFGRHAC